MLGIHLENELEEQAEAPKSAFTVELHLQRVGFELQHRCLNLIPAFGDLQTFAWDVASKGDVSTA